MVSPSSFLTVISKVRLTAKSLPFTASKLFAQTDPIKIKNSNNAVNICFHTLPRRIFLGIYLDIYACPNKICLIINTSHCYFITSLERSSWALAGVSIVRTPLSLSPAPPAPTVEAFQSMPLQEES
jgi:hypothetical protein